jgi:acetamidase/formamidase
MQATQHTLHARHHHLGWSRDNAPALVIAPGEAVEFECLDASNGQIDRESTAADVARLDSNRVNPVTGPIFVDGAEPGDVLEIEILEFSPSGWGWTAAIPGFGLLADDFPEPALHVWRFAADAEVADFGPGGRVALAPFAGTMGNASDQPGTLDIIPPRRVGGNLDTRDLRAGARLFLPVEVRGALFSVGDTHAAQGDGEVCGTAIESPMNVALRFFVHHREPLAFPRYSTPGPMTRHGDQRGYDVTTGVGPDLLEAARAAVRGMIDLLGSRDGFAPADAYMLCSACADLRITEIVDAPNVVVALYFPRAVLR